MKFIKKLRSGLLGAWKFFLKIWNHKKGRVGIIITGFVILVAVFAPVLT